MKKTPLAEFCDLKSQAQAAQIIGCTQSAISQMIKAERQIYITEDESGNFECIEIRKPKMKKAA
jgi:predicted transcriptional regulator